MSRMTLPLCLSCFLAVVPAFAAQGEDPDALARSVLAQFLRARAANNLDDLMKTVDVPWYHDGKTVITEVKELQEEFRTLLTRKSQAKVEYEVKHLLMYRDLQSRFTENERRMIDRVLAPDDRIAIIAIRTVGTTNESKVLLFIRLRDGQAKMAGIMN